MAFSLAEAYVELSAKGFGGVSGLIDRVTGKLRGLTGAAGSVIGAFASLNPLGGGLSAVMGALGAGAGIGGMLTLAANAENAAVAFKTLLGSAEAATAFVKDLQGFAKSTPFDFPGLRDTSSGLLAVGVRAENVIPLMRALGDSTAAMGTGSEGIRRAVTALSQMQQKGKVYAEEMLQLTEAGIPAWDTLASVMNTDVATAQKRVSAGQVKVNELMAGIADYAGPAMQRVKGMMDVQSKTLGGMFSSVQDSVMQSLTALGTQIVETFNLKGALEALGGAVGPLQASITEIFARIQGPIQSLMGSIGAVLSQLGAQFSGVFGQVAGGAGPVEIISGAINGLVGGLQMIVDATLQWIDYIQPVQQAYNQLFVMLSELAGATFGAISELISGAMSYWSGTASATGEFFKSFFTGLFSTAAEVVNLLRIAIENWDLMLAIGWERLKLFVDNGIEYLGTFFTNIGELTSWFLDNWSEVFYTAFDLATTVFINLGQNIRNLFSSLWAWISSGFTSSFEIDWKPLTDGFKNTIKEMPNLTKAQVKASNSTIDGLYKELEDREAKRTEDRIKAAEAASKAAGEFIPPSAAAGGNGPDFSGGDAGGPAGSGKSQQAQFIGFDQLSKTVQQAALGGENKLQQDILAENKKQTTAAQQTAANTKTLAGKDPTAATYAS